MLTWPALIGGSVVIGIACGLLFARRWVALLLGAAVPWLVLLAIMLYHEYVVPYDGGGASMWPVAQLFAGTIVAALGLITAAVTRRVRRRSPA